MGRGARRAPGWRSARARLAIAVALGLVLGGALARPAAAERPPVVIEGDDAAAVREVAKALARKVERTDDREVAVAFIEIAVTPTGKAARKAKRLTATVTVVQATDGAELGRMVVTEKRARLARAVGKAAWPRLGKAITAAAPRAPAPAPAVVVAPPPAPPPTDELDRAPAGGGREAGGEGVAGVGATATVRGAGRARFAITVDERPFWRRLRWNDDLDQVLRRYDLAANAVGVTFTARPLVGAPGAFVALGGELAVGVNGSRTSDGTEYPTAASEWTAALGYALTIRRVEVAAAVAYGEQRFAIDDEMASGGELVPDVTYRFARGGLDGRVPLAPRWTLVVRGGWRHLLGTGDLGGDAWFPRLTGAGLDGSLGAQVRLTRWLGAYARAEVRHYFFAMNPEPGDAVIAGGAVDTFLGGAIGLAVSVP
ncbi:MAG: hypothetical protein KJZ91_23625 [Myxococcales bacterium]|nr:hypothetical protein [Myxococcales bacterium]